MSREISPQLTLSQEYWYAQPDVPRRFLDMSPLQRAEWMTSLTSFSGANLQTPTVETEAYEDGLSTVEETAGRNPVFLDKMGNLALQGAFSAASEAEKTTTAIAATLLPIDVPQPRPIQYA